MSHISSTWFHSPEVFDCMFLHLFTHSCASPCFTESCLSPEMLHRIPYTLSQKTCFTGGLLDQRKLQIFRSGSRICHGAVYQMIHPYLSIRAVMSLIRHVVFWEPYSGRFENTETSCGNFPSTVCAEAQQSVSHTECVASTLPAAVAG